MVVDKCGNSVAHDDSGAGGDARAKAQALIEKIDDLRMRANDLKNAAEQERLRNNGFAENAYEAEFSRFIVRDCEERAIAAQEVIASLVGEHSSVMDEFADRSMWEDDGVTMCCECGELFFLKTLRGRFMARTCPLCGARIHEWGYDSQGRILAYKLNTSRYSGAERRREIERELGRVALARYLSSEWYLLSGTPTSARGFGATEEGYSFVPSYDKKGRFFLRACYGHNNVHGIAGEMALFDLFRMCVNDKQSPLYGAKIVPNINLTTNKVENGRMKVRKNQTDCVLLLPFGAIVFEVKRWHADICVNAVCGEITVTRGNKTTRYRHQEGPHAQVVANRKALLAEASGLNGGRVSSAVVFVDPVSLSGDVGMLPSKKHAFFGQLKTGGKGSVRKAVEECVSAWRSQKDCSGMLDATALAEQLLSECSCNDLPLSPVGRM